MIPIIHAKPYARAAAPAARLAVPAPAPAPAVKPAAPKRAHAPALRTVSNPPKLTAARHAAAPSPAIAPAVKRAAAVPARAVQPARTAISGRAAPAAPAQRLPLEEPREGANNRRRLLSNGAIPQRDQVYWLDGAETEAREVAAQRLWASPAYRALQQPSWPTSADAPASDNSPAGPLPAPPSPLLPTPQQPLEPSKPAAASRRRLQEHASPLEQGYLPEPLFHSTTDKAEAAHASKTMGVSVDALRRRPLQMVRSSSASVTSSDTCLLAFDAFAVHCPASPTSLHQTFLKRHSCWACITGVASTVCCSSRLICAAYDLTPFFIRRWSALLAASSATKP